MNSKNSSILVEYSEFMTKFKYQLVSDSWDKKEVDAIKKVIRQKIYLQRKICKKI